MFSINNIRQSLTNLSNQSHINVDLNNNQKAMQALNTDNFKTDSFVRQKLQNEYETYSPDIVQQNMEKFNKSSSISVNTNAIQKDLEKITQLFNK